MRNLREAIQIHKDHVGAVIDLDYSPTGKEIVSGSYDKTLRIFKVDEGRSRDVYHTKRMQRLTSVLWSADNNYVLCGSDEMDIRIWKSNSSQKLGLVSILFPDRHFSSFYSPSVDHLMPVAFYSHYSNTNKKSIYLLHNLILSFLLFRFLFSR